jgi:hypothetical protein
VIAHSSQAKEAWEEIKECSEQLINGLLEVRGGAGLADHLLPAGRAF